MTTPIKVLVTGASGFLATWVVKENISRGYFVRGTVRNTAKGEYLKKLFGDNFEYVIVEDIEKDTAFDEAIKEVDAVIHTASPFRFDIKDPQELIGPAVNGTTSVLKSILKYGRSVRRVVLTSSHVAMAPSLNQTTQIRYDEASWNNGAVEDVEKEGIKAHPVRIYEASKVLAEKAAWEFIFGPVIHEVSKPTSLNTSSAAFLSFLKNEPPKDLKDLIAPAGGFVDVRDVAWAHAEAVTNETMANKDAQAAFKEGRGRVALTAEEFTWQDVADALVDASVPLPQSMPRGEKGAGKHTVHFSVVDPVRAKEELGLKFRPITKTFGDTLVDFQQKGWI
ncbi:hypothetical protein M422DRAFT_241216 [Sphaerobolus stellatus SS14]|nr:hypothetical protein M422DRAFT_241216 [Sphaerobolus stellatus SS14]